MKKLLILIIAIVIILFLFGFFYFKPNKPSNLPSSLPSSTENIPSNTVIIKNFAFKSSTLTIKAGTTIVWVNEDSAPHNIKSSNFNSPNLQQGDKFEFTFNTKGTFVYNCGIHPTMVGTIIVF